MTVLLMTKLALLYSGFSWASASLLLHYLTPDFDPWIFTIASISQAAGMLILAIVGVALRVFSIWSGQDQQQQHIVQHQHLPAQLQQQKRRWIKVIFIFTLTLIACWVVLSGLKVESVFCFVEKL